MNNPSLFELARRRDWRWQDVLDLTSPASPLGPAPGVQPAIEASIERIPHVPEPSPRSLVARLAELWGVAPDQILLGNGGTELVYLLSRVWRKEASTVATPAHRETLRAHPLAKRVEWESTARWVDSGIMLVEQPNSVTGLAMDFDRLRVWLRSTRNAVVVDERWIDFADQPSAITLLMERRNLFVLRSLSGLFALPGLRVGALVGEPEPIATLEEKREPWQIDVLAEAAALAALQDTEHAEKARALVAEEREWMWTQLQKLPTVTPVRTTTNFFLLYLAGGAADLCRWFIERKVLIENCSDSPGLDGEAIRFAVGTREVNERFVGLLREYMCG
ncbi:MAG: histidinol-phosphate aminotransferase family protein [bacterium]|nr:histidinol-phosphate aminotransferase family protein [bacterium]